MDGPSLSHTKQWVYYDMQLCHCVSPFISLITKVARDPKTSLILNPLLTRSRNVFLTLRITGEVLQFICMLFNTLNTLFKLDI